MYKSFFLFLIFFNIQFFGVIRILTFQYNNPDFLELQYLCLKKFLKEDFELLVFNDARKPESEQEIENMCYKYNLRHIRFQPEWHLNNPLNVLLKKHEKDPTLIRAHIPYGSDQPSVRHSHVIQYALDNYGYNHNDIVVILDGDIFPIRPFTIRSYLSENDSKLNGSDCSLQKYDIIGTRKSYKEEGVEYLWVPFVAFNPKTLPNLKDLQFHVDKIGGYIYDTGAHSYHYLKNNPEVKVLFLTIDESASYRNLPIEEIEANGFTQKESLFIKELPWPYSGVEFHFNHSLMHFVAGSFSVGKPAYNIKSECMKRFLTDLLSD